MLIIVLYRLIDPVFRLFLMYTQIYCIYITLVCSSWTLSECQSKLWHPSSCVALMSESVGGDISITLCGWELESTGMKSSSTDSASLQGHRTAPLCHFSTLSTFFPPRLRRPPYTALVSLSSKSVILSESATVLYIYVSLKGVCDAWGVRFITISA